MDLISSSTHKATLRILATGLLVLLAANGDTRAQSDCVSGLAQNLYGCDKIDLLARIPKEDLQSLSSQRDVVRLNDIWGWTDSESGREFVLACRENGVAFVEVSDPLNPIYLGNLPFHSAGRPSRWRDVKTYLHYAYIVADGAGDHGMQIFDLRELLDVQNPPQTFEETGHYAEFASAHNVVINTETGVGFAVGASSGGLTCGGAMHSFLLTDPVDPNFAGCIQILGTGIHGSGYTHDAQCLIYRGPDAEHFGKEICFLYSENAISIVDVADRFLPETIAIIEYPSAQYAHQGWISADHKTIFANDELDELRLGLPKTRTLVFDISVLSDPILTTEHQGLTASIDHNQYVRGAYLYQSNYTSGLTIWNIGDPAEPQLEGFFDTYNQDDEVSFNGSWSNYPFFPSGIVAVSDRDNGLFLLSTPSIDHSPPLDGGSFLAAAFPSPANSQVRIRATTAENESLQLRIVNSIGQVVHQQQLSTVGGTSTTKTIDVSGYANGIYYVDFHGASTQGSTSFFVLK